MLLLHDLLHGELNVLSILDVLEVLAHAHVVVIDLLEEVVESLDDLKVAFLEGLVKLEQLG